MRAGRQAEGGVGWQVGGRGHGQRGVGRGGRRQAGGQGGVGGQYFMYTSILFCQTVMEYGKHDGIE